MPKPAVPVIMYHSIGVRDINWNFSYLTCPYQVFERQLKWLKVSNYTSITLDELYNYMRNGKTIPKKAIVLTFDDGYADNWVFAYPLLKKYEFKATIYVNPEFVDPRKQPRFNLDDVGSGNASFNDLPISGYLSWGEMKEMEEDDVIDIQSHTMSHTWLPQSDRIIDFRHPDDPYTWMTWNQNIEKKPFLQKDDEHIKDYGQPVFENGRAIGVKQFKPDKEFVQVFTDHINDNGGKNFFNSDDWKDELFRLEYINNKDGITPGRYETDEEYRARLYYELEQSKRTIEQELNKEVRFLCWPGGVATPESNEIADQLGYLSSNIPKDLRQSRKYLKNRYGEKPNQISRIGPSLYWDRVEGKGSKIIYKNGIQLLLDIERFRGSRGAALTARYVLGGLFLMYRFLYTRGL